MVVQTSDLIPAPRPLGKEEWPPDYLAVFAWRQSMLRRYRERPELLYGALVYYEDHPVEFICHWVDTYDPRNAGQEGKMTRMPLVMFSRQADLVECLQQCRAVEADALVEKCRDMGATWVCAAYSVWVWLFSDGASVGWGSRKEALVDKLGVLDSIFEKIRMIIRQLPSEFLPAGFSWREHSAHMRLVNPVTGATITGEAGDNIGRGGRTSIYFKDESAHYERPESIEAALGDNTRVQVDISSVNGPGNVFHRRREAGEDWQGEAQKNRTNVFVMEWRHHPEKNEAWYTARRKKAMDDGLMHIFAQEVDRDYFSAIENVLIPSDWIESAIDAHIKLSLPEPEGQRIGGLDVADGGGDKNALSVRREYLLEHCEHWAAPPDMDTGITTRKTVRLLRDFGSVVLQYDCIGIGAGVKSEYNRLRKSGLMPKTIAFAPWDASASPLGKDERLLKNEDGTPDEESPFIGDFFANLKAQGWWELRQRFQRTHSAVTEGLEYGPEQLISLPSDTPELAQLRKELGQVTFAHRTNGKLIVDKAPEGTRSPNMADSVVEAYWPVEVVTPSVMVLLGRG